MAHCFDCGSTNIAETVETHPMQYGNDGVVITVTEPVISCNDCGFQWTDWRGEEARDKAVQEYLRQA